MHNDSYDEYQIIGPRLVLQQLTLSKEVVGKHFLFNGRIENIKLVIYEDTD